MRALILIIQRQRFLSGRQGAIWLIENFCKLLDTNQCQTNITESLKSSGVVQKQENPVPYELKSRDIERRLFTCKLFLQWQRKKKLFRTVSLLGIQNGYITII